MPTREQAEAAIFVCQLLSNLFQPITVFRYDQKAKTIYVQGGLSDGISLVIRSDGLCCMSQDLNQLTNAELKQYLSRHRNHDEAFHDALQVLMSRRDPNAPWYPYPYDMADPEREVEAILRERISQIERERLAD